MGLDEALVYDKSLGAKGIPSPFSLEQSKAVRSADAHARYQDAILNGNCYYAAMSSGAALGTALTATAVTLTLYNPIGSGVYIVVLEGTLAVTLGLAAAASAAVVWAANTNVLAAAPTSTTLAATYGNAIIGSAKTGAAKAYTAATLPAVPSVIRSLANARIIGATPVSEYTTQIVDPVDGKIVLSPNTAVTVQAILTASALNGIASMLWEEVPIPT